MNRGIVPERARQEVCEIAIEATKKDGSTPSGLALGLFRGKQRLARPRASSDERAFVVLKPVQNPVLLACQPQ